MVWQGRGGRLDASRPGTVLGEGEKRRSERNSKAFTRQAKISEIFQNPQRRAAAFRMTALLSTAEDGESSCRRTPKGGWLYMTIGNTWVKPNAPKSFRDLQRIKSDNQTGYPLTEVYTRETHPKSYHSMKKYFGGAPKFESE